MYVGMRIFSCVRERKRERYGVWEKYIKMKKKSWIERKERKCSNS